MIYFIIIITRENDNNNKEYCNCEIAERLQVSEDINNMTDKKNGREYLGYVAVEYVLWISGCLWPGYSISAPYCWFDLLLTGCLFALLPATGKAVQV